MAKITEYTAPDRKLTQSTEGVAAFETAARRIGPAYEQAASNAREGGRLLAQEYKEQLWPWDILELQAKAADAARTRQNSGGGGVKTSGGGSSGGGSAGIGQLSRGAAAIGDVAAARPDQLKRSPSKLVDVDKLFPNATPGTGSGPVNTPFGPGAPDPRAGRSPALTSPYDPGQEVWRDPHPLPPLPGQNPDGTFGGDNPGPATQGDPTAPTPDYSNDPVPLPAPIKDFVDWSGNAPNPDESDNYQGPF